MFKVLKNNKEIVWSLAANDFATKYAGSLFGTFWAFVQPATTILIYACVFQYGLKSTSPVQGFRTFFGCAGVPWFFLSDGIRAVTNVLIEYSYLVKKVVFDDSITSGYQNLVCFFCAFSIYCAAFFDCVCK